MFKKQFLVEQTFNCDLVGAPVDAFCRIGISLINDARYGYVTYQDRHALLMRFSSNLEVCAIESVDAPGQRLGHITLHDGWVFQPDEGVDLPVLTAQYGLYTHLLNLELRIMKAYQATRTFESLTYSPNP